MQKSKHRPRARLARVLLAATAALTAACDDEIEGNPKPPDCDMNPQQYECVRTDLPIVDLSADAPVGNLKAPDGGE